MTRNVVLQSLGTSPAPLKFAPSLRITFFQVRIMRTQRYTLFSAMKALFM